MAVLAAEGKQNTDFMGALGDEILKSVVDVLH